MNGMEWKEIRFHFDISLRLRKRSVENKAKHGNEEIYCRQAVV